jgi:hypothetical protein
MWSCLGCGQPSPDRERSCDCPTDVVREGDSTAWKRPAGARATVEHCHRLIGRLYENRNIKLSAADVDLIKTALKRLCECQD